LRATASLGGGPLDGTFPCRSRADARPTLSAERNGFQAKWSEFKARRNEFQLCGTKSKSPFFRDFSTDYRRVRDQISHSRSFSAAERLAPIIQQDTTARPILQENVDFFKVPPQSA
jgi:hypothetical protein